MQKFIKRIIENRLKRQAFMKDRMHNRLITLVPKTAISDAFWQQADNEVFTLGNLQVQLIKSPRNILITITKKQHD